MRTSARKKNGNEQPFTFSTIAFLISFLLILINQGGFFQGGIVLGALLICTFLLFLNPRFSKRSVPFLLFSAWYFFCSVRTGFLIEHAIKGLIPLIIYFAYQITTDTTFKKETAIKTVLKASLLLAALSSFLCIVQTMINGYFTDAVFPFQYANTTGLYFGICYILSQNETDAFFKKSRILFLIALLLTRSLGAILLTYIASFFLTENKKKFILFSLPLVPLIVPFQDAILQNYGTLLERLLQMRDGFFCALQNPIFGIGAGKWETAKQVYQTGFYSAKVIHSSVISLCVNAGFTGLLLFCLSLFFIFYKVKIRKCDLLCLVMLFFHSLFDFSLSFPAIGCFAVFFLPTEKMSHKEIKKRYIRLISAVSLAFFLFAFCIFSTISFLKKTSGTSPIAWKNLHKFSCEANERYLYSLYTHHKTNEINALICSKEYPSTAEILLTIKISNNKEEVIAYWLNKQPFNVSLRDTLQFKNSEEATLKMSRLAKKLYELKGENKS